MSYRADRYWWAYVAAGVALLALSLLMVTVYLRAIFIFGVSFDPAFQGAIAIMIALFSLGFVAFCKAERERWHKRLQSIAGEVWVMPESRIVPATEDVFDVSREPLVLVWRSKSPFRFMIRLTSNWIHMGALLLIMVMPLSPMITLMFPTSRVLTISEPAVVLLSYPCYFILARMLRIRFVIIEALSDGIRYQPLVGKVRLMRWHDMRLLEVEEIKSSSGVVSRSFALFDNHRNVISWLEWGSQRDVVQPEGITWDELWALSRELVDVIYQRTGLTPRTFTKSLQRGAADALLKDSQVQNDEHDA